MCIGRKPHILRQSLDTGLLSLCSREWDEMDHDIQPSEAPERPVGPFELWRGGFTLPEALDRFADGRSWLRSKSRVMDRFDRLRTDPRSPMSDRVETTVRLQDMARAWEEQARLLEELRARLIGRLHAGELPALGFTVESASTSRLTIIPGKAWTNANTIDWDRSAIQAKDFAFMGVRILAPRQHRLHDGARETIGRDTDGN